MKVRAFLFSLAAFVALPAANAAVIDIPSGATNYLLGVIGPGSFTDTSPFTLSGVSNITDSFSTIFNVNNFSFALDKCASSTCGSASTIGTGTSFSSLAGGSYEWVFKGSLGNVPFPVGIYFGSYTVAAVPEPDTWLMLLVGAALLAYQLRRKQKSLPTFSRGSLSHS